MCISSRWPEVVALTSVTTRSVAEAMIDIFSRTALPLNLLTDRGSLFTGSLMNTLCEILGIERIKTTSYHFQSNGTIEHMQAMLTKPMLKEWIGQGKSFLHSLPFGRLHIKILG